MSKSYSNVNAYWKVAAPFVNDLITSRQDAAMETLLEQTIAIASFVLQDFDEKRTKNQHLVGRIDSLVVLALDVLRGAHAAQRLVSRLRCVRGSVDVRGVRHGSVHHDIEYPWTCTPTGSIASRMSKN